MKVTSRQRGFTLVELVATVAVGSVALLGTVTATLMGSTISRTTAETRLAARTTASMMEEIRAVPFADLVTTYDDTTHNMQDLLPGAPEGTLSVDVTQVDNGSDRWLVHRVVVSAAWDGTQGRQVLEFATYVSDRLAESRTVSGGADPSSAGSMMDNDPASSGADDSGTSYDGTTSGGSDSGGSTAGDGSTSSSGSETGATTASEPSDAPASSGKTNPKGKTVGGGKKK